MTDEDIRKLALEYDKQSDVNLCVAIHSDIIIDFMDWLSDKFCLVEKEKIKALYAKMELDGNHVDSDNDWAVYEAMDELEKIFGEDLFNDTEK